MFPSRHPRTSAHRPCRFGRAVSLSLVSTASVSLLSCGQHQASHADPTSTVSPSGDAAESGPRASIDRITLASGLIIEDLHTGKGEVCLPDTRVNVRYTCSLPGGAVFDSSNGEPVELNLAKMIRGWQDGVPGMRVGGLRRLTIPPDLGYKDRALKDADGAVLAPPNSTLVYDIELLGVR